MTEEETGHPQTDTPATGTESAPAQSAPSDAAPQGTPDDSLEKRLRDKDEYIGRLGKEVGDLRNELSSYRQMLSQNQGFGPAAPSQPQPGFGQPSFPQPEDKFDWDNPLRAVDTRLDRKLSEFNAQVSVNQAVGMAPFAEQLARQSEPTLFREVGDQVRSVMANGIRTRTVDPRVVADPEMWKAMAWVALGQKRGYKLGNQVNPVSPTVGESPSGNRPVDSDDIVSLDDSAKEMIKSWGEVSEGDVAKDVKELRKRRK